MRDLIISTMHYGMEVNTLLDNLSMEVVVSVSKSYSQAILQA